MKKIVFVLILGLALFAQNKEEKSSLEAKRLKMQTTIQAIKGDISDAETARKNLYDQLTRVIAFQIQKEQELKLEQQKLQSITDSLKTK